MLRILPLEEAMKTRFKIRGFEGAVTLLVLTCGAGLLGPHATAQASAGSQKPSASQPNAPKGQQNSNPFPDDTNSVPVLPSANSSATPPPDASDLGNVVLPGADSDPVRSPDDASSVEDSGSSSSDTGLDNLLRPPPDEGKGNKRSDRDGADQPHVEGAKEDESVGSYYLDQKNWRAALSRFESALVLDPENPDVYWGLAESQRHLGDFASAKANYLKVVEYDPDSKHSKESQKLLKQPELANAKADSAKAAASMQP
jgi:hypothetical protein